MQGAPADLLQAQLDGAVLAAWQVNHMWSGRASNTSDGCVCTGSSIINALGAEVDRLEAEIAKLCPGIRHIDLVSLRGQVRAMPWRQGW